jgi:hypothetical protein
MLRDGLRALANSAIWTRCCILLHKVGGRMNEKRWPGICGTVQSVFLEARS